MPELSRQGFTPQSMVCATEVPLGRPAPYISFQGALGLGASVVHARVK